MRIHPAADAFPMLDKMRLEQLADDIRAHGLLEPITLLDGAILDGRNRHEACLIAGVPPRFEDYTGSTPYSWVASKNSQRRDLTEGERAEAGLKLAPGIMAEVECERRKKQRETLISTLAKSESVPPSREGETPVRTDEGLVSSDDEVSEQDRDEASAPPPAPKPAPRRDHSAETASIVAAKVGLSRATMERAMEVQKNAPEMVEQGALRKMPVKTAQDLSRQSGEVRAAVTKRVEESAGPVRGGFVQAVIKQHVKAEVGRKLDAEPPPMPGGPYRVIVADPPWAYTKREGDLTHRGDLPYPPMTTDAICKMGVGDLAHPEGTVLWLWTTNAFMWDAREVLDAWGFEPKTILTWVKDRMGLGDWLRGQTEHCILAVRGKPTVTLTNQTTVLHGPMREHSRKPDEFYGLVEALCPGSKVELFCRTPRPGWAIWGAETEKFDAAK
jgi:N6-adenosine-specific RNA methylase IME4/ParB-like chromosome segregation protein Spo0J